MEPVINRTKPLRFYELGADAFQRLSRALIRELPDVASTQIYGINGQSQRGIDVEAQLKNGKRWAGQCKACEKDVLKHLRKAVEEFLPHLDFWKGQNIERYIVLVGCGIENTKVSDAIRHYQGLFLSHGITFEVWDSEEIRRLLRPMRAVVEQHLPVELWDQICGSQTNLNISSESRPLQLGVSTALVAEIGTIHDARLDEIRELIRVGGEFDAESQLRSLQDTASWEILLPPLKARVFRMLAGLALNRRNDLHEAKELLKKGKEIDPSGRFALTEAVIRNHEAGPTAALAMMPIPVNRDEWNLRMVLLINSGRLEEAYRALEAPVFPADAETHRLEAIIHLLHRDINKAKIAASEALRGSANWSSVRQVNALVDYYRALSPAFKAWDHLAWPVPPDWQFIRRDAESMLALRRAGERFEELASEARFGGEDWQDVACWQLACLANDPSRQTEATSLANQILSVNPVAISIVVWAVARDLEIDIETTEKALSEVCRETPKEIGPVQAYFNLLSSKQRFREAGELLDTHRILYIRKDSLEAWAFQRAQAWMAEGEVEKAEAMLGEQTNEDFGARLRVALARVNSARLGWTPAVVAAFDAEFRRTNSDESFFETCEAHHFANDPIYVADQADELVNRIGTESALRLALDATAGAKRFEQCLSLMEHHRTLFRDGDFPPVVRRLRVLCLRGKGRLLEAERELRLLTDDQGLPEDRFELFGLQLSTGRSEAAAITARSLLEEPRLSAGGLFQMAEKLRPENPELARTIFFEAAQRRIESPHEAAFGLHVGINLGLDDHIDHLLEKAVAAIGTPDAPLAAMSTEDLIAMGREREEARSKVELQYQRGEIPIHSYARLTGQPLAALIHLTSIFNRASDVPPSKQWNFRARYGAWRHPRPISQKSQFGLYLDITSLLLAAHLEMLGALEAEFAPIFISSWVIESLRGQLEMVTSGQPARIAPREQVLALVTDQKLKLLDASDLPPPVDLGVVDQLGPEWCSLFAHAKNLQGWLVDFLPLTSNTPALSPVPLSEGMKTILRSAGDLLIAMESFGDLSAEQVETARGRLGPAALPSGAPTAFGQDMTVVLERGLAEELAYAGILRPLAARARIVILREETYELRRELTIFSKREELADWLRTFKERLRAGLEAGRYAVEQNPEPVEFDSLDAVPSEIRCLRDFVNRSRPSSRLSCCDDRLLGRSLEVGDSRIVDLFDVLWYLRKMERLSAASLFGILHLLRAGNVRYLPLTAEEIAHHVRAAHVIEGEQKETQELATMRRYFAACLLDNDNVQRLPVDHPEALKFSEALFFAGQHRVFGEAILTLWKDASIATEAKLAGSDWILKALWFDLAAMPSFSKAPSIPVEGLFGMSEAHLIIATMSLDSGKSAGAAAPLRRAFLDWFLSRIGIESRRLELIAREIKRVLVSMVEGRKVRAERDAAKNIVGGLFVSFPAPLLAAIRFSKAELRILEWGAFAPVSFEKVEFDGRLFWPAAESAVAGKLPAVPATKPQGEIFRLRGETVNGRIQIVITEENGTGEFRVSDMILELLQKRPANRLESLNTFRRELDFDSSQAKVAFPKLARCKRADLRMRDIGDLRLASFANQLRRIGVKLVAEKQFDISHAHPLGVKSLLRHARLPVRFADGKLPNLVESAARILIADEGFIEAFDRCASLPIAMPCAILEAWRRLGSEGRRNWIDKMGKRPSSPMLRFHAATLLLRGNENERDHASKLLITLASTEGRDDWKLFECILNWAHACLRADEEKSSNEASPILASAWIHAARLHQLLGRGHDSETMQAFFREHTPANSFTVFDRPTTHGYDVAHPGAFSLARFFATGLSHSIREDFPTRLVSPQLRESILQLLYPNGVEKLPDILMLEQRRTAPNCLGSFLGSLHFSGLESLLGAEIAERLSDTRHEAEANAYVSSTLESPGQPENWVCMSAYLKSQPPSVTQRPSLLGILTEFSFKKLVDPTFDQLRLIATFYFAHSAHLFGPDMITAMEERYLELMGVLVDPIRRYDAEASGLLLANCAFLASEAASSSQEAAALFGAWTMKTAEMWKYASEALLPQMLRLILRQLPEVQSRLWHSTVSMRASAERLRIR